MISFPFIGCITKATVLEHLLHLILTHIKTDYIIQISRVLCCVFLLLYFWGIKQRGIELPYIRTNFAYINGLYRIFEYHFIKVVPLSFTVLKLLTTFFFLSTIKTGLFYFILYQRQFSKRIVNKIVNNGEGKKIGE